MGVTRVLDGWMRDRRRCGGGNGCAAYTDNKPASAWALPDTACLLSALLVMHRAAKLAALQWEAETEKMSERAGEKKREWEREECNLLTRSLKELFTCVDTLEWLEGLSACWEKELRRGGKRGTKKSNKSDWYSPPPVGQNARCSVNHDALTVRPGPSWHYPTSCLRFMILGRSSLVAARAQRLMFIQNRSTYFSYTTSERDTLILVKPL